MPEHPAFAPHLHVEVVPGTGVALLAENRKAFLAGALFAQLAGLVDGRRSGDDIARRLEGCADPEQVRAGLADMAARGYLVEAAWDGDPGEAAAWSLDGLAPSTAASRLAEATVAVTGVAGVDAGPLRSVLAAAGPHIADDGDLLVVVTDDYLRSGLGTVNDESLRTGRPWMLVKPLGREVWVGPVFRPEATACWECLAQRLRHNRPVEGLLARRSGTPEPVVTSRASTASSRAVAWHLATIAVTGWLAGPGRSRFEGDLLTFDVGTGRADRHPVAWRPQCPACGAGLDPPPTTAAPIVLRSHRKAFTRDGGHRVVPPEVTLARFGHHISRVTGALASLESVGSSPGYLHVYRGGYDHETTHLLASLGTSLGLGTGTIGGSAGKGATDAQARASGLCEGLERYSGMFEGHEPRQRGTLRRWGDRAIHPNLCMGFSEQQYEQRVGWRHARSFKERVPVRLDEDREMDWTPVWSLTRNEARFLPTEFCYYQYGVDPDEACCVACSNGNAAGNTLEEAVLQGFLELVERDAVAMWWYNRLARPAVALDSFDDPYLAQLGPYLRGRGLDLWALDLTNDLGLPVFAALSRQAGDEPDRIRIGFGAHLDARIALLRAVTELNQSLASVLGPADEAPGGSADGHPDDPGLATAAYLEPDPGAPPRRAADYCSRTWSDDFRDDVVACQRLVEDRGMEMLVLDQTRPDIGLPVVKVIVPGLRHFWPRFAPGRLYDVPVALGWLAAPRSEQELNRALIPA